MLMETAGNAGLVKEFAAANATFPVSNSLMYSIYKMLPNDTDLTVLESKAIFKVIILLLLTIIQLPHGTR
jgi:hypothetical protein